MSTIQADALAISALRDYLLLSLPAKVTAVNATRAATLRAPRAGPYTVVGDVSLGTTVGTGTTVTLTTGSRTAAQVAAEVNAAVTGITASADTSGRLLLTADDAPVDGTPSVLWLGPDGTAGANAAFGWGPGGTETVVSALVEPSYDGITDGQPDAPVDLGQGFWLKLGERTVEERDRGANRSDVRIVRISAEVLAAEPHQRVSAMQEFVSAATRAVRECIAEDRTLGGAVYLCELGTTINLGIPFRFAFDGLSILYSSASFPLAIHVFERT